MAVATDATITRVPAIITTRTMSFSFLPSDVDRVGRWLDFSQIAYVIAMALTVVFTMGIVVFSKRHSLLKDEQFAAYKVKAEADTKERIATVQGDAQKEIARVEGEAKKEAARIEGDAKKEIASARLETERLKTQNLATEARLEAERKERLELEKSFAFRWITKRSLDDISELKKHAGTHVTILFSSEAEPTLLANQLVDVLTKAEWKIDNFSPFFGFLGVDMFTGLSVLYASWEPPKEKRPSFTEDRAGYDAWMQKQQAGMAGASQGEKAASAIRNFLESNGFTVSKGPDWRPVPDDPNVPLKLIELRIGNKVNTYLLPDEVKKQLAMRQKRDDEFRQQEKDMERRFKEAEERNKHWLEERQRHLEEYQRHLDEEKKRIPPLIRRPDSE